jgi:hypothetical protein
MVDPILESSLKTDETLFSATFLLLSKKVDKFQLCLENSCMFVALQQRDISHWAWTNLS